MNPLTEAQRRTRQLYDVLTAHELAGSFVARDTAEAHGHLIPTALDNVHAEARRRLELIEQRTVPGAEIQLYLEARPAQCFANAATARAWATRVLADAAGTSDVRVLAALVPRTSQGVARCLAHAQGSPTPVLDELEATSLALAREARRNLLTRAARQLALVDIPGGGLGCKEGVLSGGGLEVVALSSPGFTLFAPFAAAGASSLSDADVEKAFQGFVKAIGGSEELAIRVLGSIALAPPEAPGHEAPERVTAEPGPQQIKTQAQAVFTPTRDEASVLLSICRTSDFQTIIGWHGGAAILAARRLQRLGYVDMDAFEQHVYLTAKGKTLRL